MAAQVSINAGYDRLTRAGSFAAQLLEEQGLPIITPYNLFWLINRVYKENKQRRLYLRRETPQEQEYNRLRRNLMAANVLRMDRDYGSRAYAVTAIPDLAADEILCIVDPLCHISFLSAMQRWGLTNRASEKLQIVRPDRRTSREKLNQIMQKAEESFGPERNPISLPIISHPNKVRRKLISVTETSSHRECQQLRGTEARIARIEQTFIDMVQHPEKCGGMRHVIDVWAEHAKRFILPIIEYADKNTKGLVQSRVGYIVEEVVGIQNELVNSWVANAQRGGSRLLDPQKPFASKFSERWALSINV